MKIFIAILLSLFTFSVASAHVVVLPASAPAESYQTFIMGVPVERDMPTVGMRLVIPEGVMSTRPNVKVGWNINVKKEMRGDKEVVTEITWTGGSIPPGLRDEFIFSAKTPKENEGKLLWKAYQTYSDGTVITWDADPGESHDHGTSIEGPASVTVITGHDEHGSENGHGNSQHAGHDMLLPLLGIGLALAAIIEIGKIHRKKN